MSEPLCANCGHPRNNHPFRHPFAGPSKDDTIKELETKLAKAVKALEYADRMVRLDLFRMTDFDCGDFSQAVVDTGERIKATLAELKGDKE